MSQDTSKRMMRWLGRSLICAVLLLGICDVRPVWAAFGGEEEKIEAQMTQDGSKFTAKLIPRAKSSSVLIDFAVSQGRLADVKGMLFAEATRPDVDHKDFKSELFVATIVDIAPGSEVRLAVTSDFFTGSTAFWVFNEKAATPWMNAEAEVVERGRLVIELGVTVTDGGKLDSDGDADGRITIVGGPRDSFWGYALGTLFIRFFGIFLVLSILMIGMLISGRIFIKIENERESDGAAEPPGQPVEALKKEDSGQAAEEKLAAPKKDVDVSDENARAMAIALALHLNLAQPRGPEPMAIYEKRLTAWNQQGREKIMGDRFLTFNRMNR